jgi:hypothetical protein
MTTVEGVTLREAVEWCGDQISVREATRLRRQAENDQDAQKRDEDGATVLAATAAASGSGETCAGTQLDNAGFAALAAALAGPRVLTR